VITRLEHGQRPGVDPKNLRERADRGTFFFEVTLKEKEATHFKWLNRHPWAARILLVCVSLVGTVAVAELILRASGSFSLGVERTIRLREHNPESLRYLPFSHTNAPELSGRSYRLRIDTNGFIMPGAPHRNPDVSVVFLGGSTTECLHMDDDHRFPCQVGSLIEVRSGLAVNSYNGGMAGNHSLHSIDGLLNKVLPLEPEVVVMMHNINDFVTLLHHRSYWNESPTRSVLEVIGSYHAFRAVKNLLIPNLFEKIRSLRQKTPDEFNRVRGRKAVIDQAWMAGQFEANLQIFIDVCRAREITPVLMTQQSRFKEDPDPEVEAETSILATRNGVDYATFRQLHILFNDRIRAVGTKNDVEVIDLAALVPQEREFIYGTVHLNQRGSDFASSIIADRLTPLMLPSSDATDTGTDADVP